jgi:hypothetical protein
VANGNTWTVNNLSVTAGSGNDSLVDTPTSYGTPDTGVGGEVRGNYCTWNPLNKNSNITLSNGNLDATGVITGASHNAGATLGFSSGKWYWEILAGRGAGSNNGGWEWGIAKSPFDPIASTRLTVSAYGWGVNGNDGTLYSNNSSLVSGYISGTAGSVISNGDTVMVAYDADTGKLWLGKNGTWGNNGGTGDPAAGTNAAVSSLTGTFFPVVTIGSDSGTPSAIINAGARPFAYTAPSGFKALCTTNLPEPTIADGSTVMDVALYTGNGSTQTISGLNFSPDLVWIKGRNQGRWHMLFDVIRGPEKFLSSNDTQAEATHANSLTAFNSDGFSLGSDSNANVNFLNYTYAAWCWDAGTSPPVSNPDGSITSQVQANASAGFSVVTWTGNASAGATIGHSLGIAPRFVIFKARSISENWNCYHGSLGASQQISLNLTGAAFATNDFNNTAPSSTLITLGSGTGNNGSGKTYVAYAFAPVAGYSSFGSYTGNGSADGPFVYTGFRPRWVMIKNTTGTAEWLMRDTERDPYNNNTTGKFYADDSRDERVDTTDLVDITSNGFKMRGTDSSSNSSSATYIYAAFAENPFQYARAR